MCSKEFLKKYLNQRIFSSRSDPRFLISINRKFVRNQTNVTVKRFFSSKTQQVNLNFGRPNVDSPFNP